MICHLILVLVLSQWLNFGLFILALSALEYKFRKVVFESDSQAALSLILKGCGRSRPCLLVSKNRPVALEICRVIRCNIFFTRLTKLQMPLQNLIRVV